MALLAAFGAGGCLRAEGADTIRQSVITADEAPSMSPAVMPASTRRTDADQPGPSTADPLEKTKLSEIIGEQQEDRRARRFLELVVLPLTVCLLLAIVLRRGFLD